MTFPQPGTDRGRVPARRVRIGDGRVGRDGVRMGPPLAGTHARRIGRVAGGAVILAKRQHRGAGSAADGHTLVPRGAGGDAGDRRGIGLLDQGQRGALLSGRAEAVDDTDKHRMGGRRDRGIGRRGRVRGPLEVVGVVLAVDRIQRVVDGPVHHREGARRHDGVLAVRLDELHRRLIPLDDLVGGGGWSEGETKRQATTAVATARPMTRAPRIMGDPPSATNRSHHLRIPCHHGFLASQSRAASTTDSKAAPYVSSAALMAGSISL